MLPKKLTLCFSSLLAVATANLAIFDGFQTSNVVTTQTQAALTDREFSAVTPSFVTSIRTAIGESPFLSVHASTFHLGAKTITSTTKKHRDNYKNGESVVSENVAFVMLNTNPDAHFSHGETSVPIKAGTAVSFRGDVFHHTIVNSGSVSLLGPFAVESQRELAGFFMDEFECVTTNEANVNCIPLDNDNIHSAVVSWNKNPTNATYYYGNIVDWYTGNVTDMSSLFARQWNFNEDIGGWKTQNVTTMRAIFQNAKVFNSNIGGWNTGKVTDLSYAFNQAPAFNQNIGSWDVRNVEYLNVTFYGADSFNSPLTNWDVRKVKSLYVTFYGASNFSQPLDWTTTSLTNIDGVFQGATLFNQPLAWQTEKVTNMDAAFRGAENFNQLLTFDTSAVTSMHAMFKKAAKFNGDLSMFNTSLVTDMGSMFQDALSFAQDLSMWCVPLIGAEPDNFGNANGTQPLWGTCPTIAPSAAPSAMPSAVAPPTPTPPTPIPPTETSGAACHGSTVAVVAVAAIAVVLA